MSAFTREEATGRSQAWLAAHARDDFSISAWTITEFAAALSIKLRTGSLLTPERDGAQSRFERFVNGTARLIEVESRHFRAGARLAARHESGLRSGDALHLAICSETGATLCTLDRKLGAACTTLGLPALMLGD